MTCFKKILCYLNSFVFYNSLVSYSLYIVYKKNNKIISWIFNLYNLQNLKKFNIINIQAGYKIKEFYYEEQEIFGLYEIFFLFLVILFLVFRTLSIWFNQKIAIAFRLNNENRLKLM